MSEDIQKKFEPLNQRKRIIQYSLWFIVITAINQYSIYNELNIHDINEYDILGYMIIMYFGYRLLYKTIHMSEDFISYNGYFKRIKIRYEDIQSIEIREAKSEKKVDYNLIIMTSCLNRIEKIQRFKECEIHLLIDKLYERQSIEVEQRISINRDFSEINWEND